MAKFTMTLERDGNLGIFLLLRKKKRRKEERKEERKKKESKKRINKINNIKGMLKL